MAMLMQQVDLPKEQPFGGGATPAPVPTVSPVPGTGVATSKAAAPGPSTPPSNDNSAGPGAAPTPKPKPAAVVSQPAEPAASPQPVMFRTPSGRMVSSIDEVNFEIFGTRRPAASNISGDQQAAIVAENRDADAILRQSFTDEMRRAAAQMQSQGMSSDQIAQQLAQQFPTQSAATGATPMPKAPGIPMPKDPMAGRSITPPRIEGPAVDGEPLRHTSTPTVPAVTPGGGQLTLPAATPQRAAHGGGGVRIMDWRQGLSENDRQAITRTVQDNELTSRQMARLLDENGRFIQSARLRAREGAAAGGMLMSTLAAGAAERSAIDAAMPIAQSDANTFFSTAQDNMRAQNEDAQADQGQGRQLFGQAMNLDANLQDSELNRQFQSGENAANRSFQGEQASLDRALTMDQNERQRQTQMLMQQRGISADDARQIVDQNFRAEQAMIEQNWRGDQAERDRAQTRLSESNRMAQDRFNSFLNMQGAREQQLAQTLSSIFGNPNLSAAQQSAAAANARAMFASINEGTNAALSAGVPEIFARPFVMAPGQAPPRPAQPQPALPPGVTPIAGTDLVRGPDGIIRRLADVVRGGG